MELLSPITTSYSSRINSGFSLFSASFSIKFWNKENPLRNIKPSSTSFNFARGRRNLLIFANFSRPTRRSNSLRKKLIYEKQVPQNHVPDNLNHIIQFPESISNDNEKSSNSVSGVDIIDSSVELKPKPLGESVLWNRLENWVDQYKSDIEFWGIGSGPIFTIFQDSNGNVKWVSVNEDEILTRSQVGRVDSEESTELNRRISVANVIARDMESGKNVIPRNSSVAKFVVQSDEAGFLKAAQGLSFRPEVFKKFSGGGVVVLCSCFVLFSLKRLFSFKKEEVEYSEFEKEMMRRKIKSRNEKGEKEVENSGVEVIQVRAEPPTVPFEKPKLDTQELMRTIAKLKSKASYNERALEVSSSTLNASSADLSNKIQEIRDMVRIARKIEGKEDSLSLSDGVELLTVNGKLPNKDEVTEHIDEGACFSSGVSKDSLTKAEHVNKDVESGLLQNVSFAEKKDLQVSSISSVKVPLNGNSNILDTLPSDTNSDTHKLKRDSGSKKPKVIRTVKEAREYLSGKCGKQKPDEKTQVRTTQDFAAASRLPSDNRSKSETRKGTKSENEFFEPSFLNGALDSSPLISDNVESPLNVKQSIPIKDDLAKSSVEGHEVGGSKKLDLSLNHESNDSSIGTMPHAEAKNWIEDNFNEVEPVAKKIGVGFRDNFKVAREKGGQQLGANSTLAQLQYDNDNDEELEWMEDDNLREIVLKVRDNELSNRDPFYSMDAEDKHAFFTGLEKKVEKENEKLLKLHEWLHLNIENLDYGADGISIYDPPEKVIPRWKDPPFEKSPEFFSDFLEQRKAIFTGKASSFLSVKNNNEQDSSLKLTESNPNGNMSAIEINDPKMTIHDQNMKDSKTYIEGSDGSIRPGKKSGKEFWQHTKKWSMGFLESYNAETDPEVKSTMKDIGKDLDRWITEKEVQEAADLMDKMPERNKKFIENKLNKVKREMEMFGPQAVVSKYSEYAEEKEEDYLWWLDLRHVLCIELYTANNGEQRIGFYSLEMAADLELEPKPCHVIAFEDAGDCKNFCYIIQSHLEMLGTGNAFIVPRPPKDTFREANANGFGVTVIRKGELQLNVDQTLEDVEEQITEIGSKMYHDKIMKERSVDISSLMKGVFGLSKNPKRRGRSKRKLKKLRKT